MINFAIRNLKVFFKDKSSVFFSLLAVFLIIGLYALFLGDAWESSLTEVEGSRYIMDSWIIAGLLAVTSVTTTMGAFGIMIDDRTKKIIKDFNSSPINRSSIAGGYILSSYIIGVIMSLISLVLGEFYIVMNGGEFMSFTVLIKVIGLVLLSTFTSVSMVLFMVTFFKSTNAFSTASTIIGTLIGFLTGIYMPIGQLPETIQWLIKLFPVSHAAALLRQVMMEAPMENAFVHAPAGMEAEFKELMGVVFKFGDATASSFTSVIVLIVTAVVFYGLSIYNLSRKSK